MHSSVLDVCDGDGALTFGGLEGPVDVVRKVSQARILSNVHTSPNSPNPEELKSPNCSCETTEKDERARSTRLKSVRLLLQLISLSLYLCVNRMVMDQVGGIRSCPRTRWETRLRVPPGDS